MFGALIISFLVFMTSQEREVSKYFGILGPRELYCNFVKAIIWYSLGYTYFHAFPSITKEKKYYKIYFSKKEKNFYVASCEQTLRWGAQRQVQHMH